MTIINLGFLKVHYLSKTCLGFPEKVFPEHQIGLKFASFFKMNCGIPFGLIPIKKLKINSLILLPEHPGNRLKS